jgi:hypothetical protein
VAQWHRTSVPQPRGVRVGVSAGLFSAVRSGRGHDVCSLSPRRRRLRCYPCSMLQRLECGRVSWALCSVIFCEATAIYGVIISIILANKVSAAAAVRRHTLALRRTTASEGCIRVTRRRVPRRVTRCACLLRFRWSC